MKITLDTRAEINAYFNYLIETDSLYDSVPTVELIDDAATAYLTWLSDAPAAAETAARSQRTWSAEEAAKLKTLIQQGKNLLDMTIEMGRTENSIRSYARSNLNLVLRNGAWKDVNYNKE
jgi:hypothetical protein